MNEERIYEALGLTPPAAPPPAEPSAEPPATEPPTTLPAADPPATPPAAGPTAAGAPDAEPAAAQPPDGAGQTEAQNREAAARRRAQERQAAIDKAVAEALKQERDRQTAEQKEFFERAGIKNTVSGQPITNMKEFDEWQAEFQAQKLSRELKAGQLTPETFNAAVAANPAVRAAAQAQKRAAEAEAMKESAAKAARARELMEADLAEIRKLDPTVNSLEDFFALDRAEELKTAISRGQTLLSAYRNAYFDRLVAAAAEQARTQALSSQRGREHLGTVTPQGGGAASVPPDEMRIFRAVNPQASEADIAKYYNKYKGG